MSDERPTAAGDGELDVLLRTEQTFPPPPEFAAQANASDPGVDERAAADPEAWWGSWAEKLEWIEPFDEILDWSEPPFAKWFTGGKLNVSANCLDRHVAAGNGERVAYFWEGEDGTRKEITYAWLLEQTQKAANGLKSLGIGLPRRRVASAVISAFAPDTSMRSTTEPAEKPPKTTLWMAPIRVQASIATAASGTIGR